MTRHSVDIRIYPVQLHPVKQKKSRKSPIAIKTVEPSTLTVLQRDGFETLVRDFPEMKDFLFELVSRRFAHYSHLLLSYLKNNPRERYLELLKENPEIVRCVLHPGGIFFFDTLNKNRLSDFLAIRVLEELFPSPYY